jgi:hypothetical protein
MIVRYPDGQSDGEEIPCPTDDESIIVQRHVIRDMRCNPQRTVFDPTLNKVVSIQEFFYMHAMTMLVIKEIEDRLASGNASSKSHVNQ